MAIEAVFGQPFAEQLAFFRAKLNLPTERWDDIWQSAHDRAFMVAGAQKADLLADLRGAVDKVIDKGVGIEEFRRDFFRIAKERGWTNYTGADTEVGRAWRTRVIYQTNLYTSHAAGRWQQLHDPDLLAVRPFWRYIHNDSVTSPRPLHKQWGDTGLTLRHDHPFWQTHFPPNGWGCRCRVKAVRGPQEGDATAPPDGWDELDPKTGAPAGIDKGWAYASGASNADELRTFAQEKAASLPERLGKEVVRDLVASNMFSRWFSVPAGDFPIAVISARDAQRIGSKKTVAVFSAASHIKQSESHPELTKADYARVQDIVDEGVVYQDTATSLLYVLDAPDGMTSVIKATTTGEGLFLTSLRHLPTDDVQRKAEIERIKRKAKRYEQNG